MRSMIDYFSKRLFLIVVIAGLTISITASAAISPVEIVTSAKPWVVLVVLIWEYLVGKTKVVKSNSTIELIESGVKKIFGITQDDLRVG